MDNSALSHFLSRCIDVLRGFLIESPLSRTLFSSVFPIAAGVLSGTFVFEITSPTGLLWRSFYRAPSFYWLCGLTATIYLYNRAVFLCEREAKKFLNADYCIAYMRSKCLPEAADRYKKLIRNGDGGELKQAMDELRRILK